MKTLQGLALKLAPVCAFLGAVLIAAGFGAPGAIATEYTLLNSTVGNGGGTVSGGGKQLVGTVGQYAVGVVEGGGFSLMSGIGHDVYGILWTEVGADVDQISAVPKQFALAQNFPNPFNPRTAVSYRLTAVSFVTLKIFDALGREVAVLVADEQAPGEYRVEFDGGGLTSGVYVARLQAGIFSQSIKMVLLK